ncbi:MAG: prepilin-type N-terminal cleavage/methylation domain-containing protein [Phycisphaeraceae bacterium]
MKRQAHHPARGVNNPSARGFTLIELLVVISIIALLIAILLPALKAARISAYKVVNSTHLRGIHQGMVIHAEGNNGYFPGLHPQGREFSDDEVDAFSYDTEGPFTTEGRLTMMMYNQLCPPEYMINPADKHKSVWTGWDERFGGHERDFVENWEYSYAMLNIGDYSGPGNPTKAKRYTEWQTTLNGEAVVMSDRAVVHPFRNDQAPYQHPWVPDAQTNDDWEGSVLWNDNHVSYEKSPLLRTRYGDIRNPEDHLFEIDNDGQEALMIYKHWYAW